MPHRHITAAHHAHVHIKQFLESKVLQAVMKYAQPAIKFVVNGLKTELLLSSAEGAAVLAQVAQLIRLCRVSYGRLALSSCAA
jgi:hypothetical protein